MADVLPLITAALASLRAGQLPPEALLKSLVSKSLGYGIVVGSTLVKLPQLLNVVRARSADGLSAAAIELESWGLLVHAAYGALSRLPFSGYGEAVILLAQNLVLLGLVYRYARAPPARAAGVFALLAGAAAAVVSGRVPRAAVTALYDANNLVLLAARVPQIAKNFAAKSTGQLSGITFGVNTAGCVARIFTTLHEGGGAAMLRSYALSLLLNATLVAQVLLYGDKGVAARRAPATRAARTKKRA